jgi:hypothetical protein
VLVRVGDEADVSGQEDEEGAGHEERANHVADLPLFATTHYGKRNCKLVLGLSEVLRF